MPNTCVCSDVCVVAQIDREHIREYCKRVIAKGPDGCAVSEDDADEHD